MFDFKIRAKKAEMQQKSGKCTLKFKINAKKDKNAKIGQKCNFNIHTKKAKKKKIKHIFWMCLSDPKK